MQRTRDSYCTVTGKVRYRTEHDVAVASRRVEWNRAVRLFYYLCDWCGCWHLTRQPNDHS